MGFELDGESAEGVSGGGSARDRDKSDGACLESDNSGKFGVGDQIATARTVVGGKAELAHREHRRRV